MSILFAPPRFKATDLDNSPIPGAFLSFYQTTTSTPQPIYADFALQIPLTNPIQADGNGLFPPIWLDDQLPLYKVVFASPDPDTSTVPGATLWTLDPYNTVGVLYRLTATESAAGITPLNTSFPPLDPRRYNSISDWSTVYGAVSSLAASYEGWYRGDHAQHPSLTNAIVGFESADDSLQTGTVGWHCTYLGAQAGQFGGQSSIAGGTNIGVGWAALQHNIEGSGNLAVGPLALNALTGVNSAHNVVIGYRGFPQLVNGTQNNSHGFQCGDQVVTGSNNHLFGENPLSHAVIANGNHGFGYQFKFSAVAANYSHGMGFQVLFSENAATVTAITVASSAVVTLSTVSLANPFTVGSPVGLDGVLGMTQINGLTTGVVTAIGGSSGAWTVTTNINSSGFTAYGSGGYLFPLGNTAMGMQACAALTYAGANTVAGWQAGQANPLDFGNTLTGFQTGMRLSVGGTLNTAAGYQSMVNALGAASCVCIGQQSGTNIINATSTVCIGDNSGQGVISTSGGVFVGSTTGVNLNGNNNTAVGEGAGSVGSAQTYTNVTCLGAAAIPNGSNQVVLGNSSVATIRGQVTSITALSDKRFKKNIQTLDVPDAFLDEVQIVSYRWIAGHMPEGTHIGVIAQQLDALQNKYGVQWLRLVDKFNPDRWEATPGKLLFLLLQRVQRQELRLKAIEAKLGL